MNLKEYLSITPEISAAIRDGKPVVALESTILSHGMPYPDNLAFAAEVERIVRAEGAVPATMAIIDGVLKVGLTQDELELMCKGEGVAKVSVYAALQQATRNGKTKAPYGKGEHSFKLLARIDPAEVIAASPWARRFVETLKGKMDR